MRGISAAALVVAASSLVSNVAAIPKISRSGRFLVDESGERFYIKGVAYQEQGAVVESDDNAFGELSTFVDPLSIGDACARDLPYLQDLGVNTLRVYSVNSSLNHDDCMKTFSDAGIYTILDLALPLNGSIDRVTPSWSGNIMDQYLRTIDTFSKYDNVLAVNVGNEVVTPDSLPAAPFVKAAARDVKAYLASKDSSVLVGYAAIDGATDFRVPLAEFFSCDSDAVAIDIYGLNEYAWCGESTYADSYEGIDNDYADYNVVAYFSEYGCISTSPRVWTEVEALFSEPMTDHWSGGIAFSYFPAESVQGQFGMVTIDGNSVTTSTDFDNLKTQYAAIAPPNSPTSGSDTYPTCPSALDTSTTLPGTPNDAACSCIFEALACQFTPPTANYTVILGELLNTACSLLGEAGGSCTDVGADGATGTYGRVSGCDPTIKLSYAMSQYYALNNNDEQACSFAGNGTVNSASNTQASAVASSCLPDAAATFTPSAPPSLSAGGGNGNGGSSTSGGGSTGGGSSGSTGGANDSDGAVSLVGDSRAVAGLVAMVMVGAVSGIWTLL